MLLPKQGSIVVLGALAVCLHTTPAYTQVIGVFGDSTGTSLNLDVPFPGDPVNAYILFVAGGDVPEIAAADLKVEGLPDGWITNSIPNPLSNLSLGDPFDTFYGAIIAFPDCQTTGTVLLYIVQITPTSCVQNQTLTVEEPFNDSFQCGGPPVIIRCDVPVFTRVCISGASTVINDVPPCPVAVASRSWSSIKGLYRE